MREFAKSEQLATSGKPQVLEKFLEDVQLDNLIAPIS